MQNNRMDIEEKSMANNRKNRGHKINLEVN